MSDWPPTPWTSTKRPQFVRANRVPATLPPTLNVPEPPRPGWANLYGSLADAGDLVGGAVRSVVGEPEKLLTGERSQVDTPLGQIVYPSGLGDALADLPMFGGIMREGEQAMKPFFSQLKRTVEERAPSVGLAEHFLNVARKGAKAEELEWSGLEPWLRERSGQRVTKAEVLAHLDASAPELRERMIGDIHSAQPHEGASYVPPKFTQYTLPGGENHRELVVTLPSKGGTPPDSFMKWIGEKSWRDVYENVDPQLYTSLDQLRATLGSPMNAPLTEDIFNSLPPQIQSHFRYGWRDARMNFTDEELGIEPNKDVYNVPEGHKYGDPELDVNRLMHMRFNDRTTAEGEKALHLDELQSDWHQAGREHGYMQRGDANGDQTLRNELNDQMGPGFDQFTNVLGPNGDRLKTGVPDAPFKKTWHELGMRRAAQEAAHGGYDRLTWTTGAQQADRYSLAKHFSKLEYDPETGMLQAYNRTGEPVHKQVIAPDKLADYVGQDVAKKLSAPVEKAGTSWTPVPVGRGDEWQLMNNDGEYGAKTFTTERSAKLWMERNLHRPTNVVEGNGLTVGGEGMKGFYDRMLPAAANKVGRKYGLKAEQVAIGLRLEGRALGDAIRGLADASHDGNVKSVLTEIAHKVGDPSGLYKTPDDAIRWFKDNKVYPSMNMDYGTMSKVRKLLDTMPKGDEKVWSLRITPEMRRDILENGQQTFGSLPPIPARPDKKPVNDQQ